ncbi:Cof subfamily protein (haloacid dehalogenase superfamily) [Pectinatus haikarae]|uniref:Cof subfamily protein (Haloacid dehalogenase superfamily) n=1 Tax=Pectinatus haikarae TaxID=349096 RepID=A0ABT9Y9J1_9FIRM|nr:HAD-IIB family hydrolase [Pectinatus haikarae]MDQ0204298.1 Cof subfamily protein (haloacid dehalogenase superfamily) [Pectinatus haikarae]
MNKYHGLLLAYNGGVVTDHTTEHVIYSNTIPNLLAKRLLRHLETSPVNPIVDDGHTIYTTDPESFMVPYEKNSNHLDIKKVTNICDAVDFSPAKILITAPPETLNIETKFIKETFKDDLSFVLSAPFYLEATPIGVNKAASMEKVCTELNIPVKAVIAFGDAQNDILMLAFAGMAVAMGNACNPLKKIADMITTSNNEDGIAVALKKLNI